MDGSAAPIGDVIMLSAEDDAADTIRPRLDAAGADVNRVFVLEAVTTATHVGTAERGFSLRADIDTLDRLLASMPDCQLERLGVEGVQVGHLRPDGVVARFSGW